MLQGLEHEGNALIAIFTLKLPFLTRLSGLNGLHLFMPVVESAALRTTMGSLHSCYKSCLGHPHSTLTI